MANQAIFSLEQEAAMKAGMRLPVQETGATTRATSATYALMGGLEVEHRDTDAVHTMVVGKLYVVDISAWSNSGNGRVWTLPTSANVGERIGIMLEVGDDTEHLAITAATSDFLNGVDGGTEWSRLFITNECVIMRCVTADSKWIVEYDGRIPCVGILSETDADTPTEQNIGTKNTWHKITFTTGADSGVGDIADNTNNRINIRRDGNYILSGGCTVDDLETAEFAIVALAFDDTDITDDEIARFSNYGGATAAQVPGAVSIIASLTVSTNKNIFTRVYHNEDGETPVCPAASPRWLAAAEILE